MGTKEGTELASNRQWESYYCTQQNLFRSFTIYIQVATESDGGKQIAQLYVHNHGPWSQPSHHHGLVTM
jgi:hypothetical protein